MPFQISPGVQVIEKDLTSIIPAVASSTGAYAGVFGWGPVLDPTLVSSENQLTNLFGKPGTDDNGMSNVASWFTAANFLSYTGAMWISRVDTAGSKNAVAIKSGTVDSITVGTSGAGYVDPQVSISVPTTEGGIRATAEAVIGGSGEILSINVVNPGSGYVSTPTVTITDAAGVGATATAVVEIGGVRIRNEEEYDSLYLGGGGSFGPFAAKYPGALGNSLRVIMVDRLAYDATTVVDGRPVYSFEYRGQFDGAPGTSDFAEKVGAVDDEVHVIVVDKDGLWTGTKGSILEKFSYLSKASNGKKPDGSNIYYKDVINLSSSYIWWMGHPSSTDNWGIEAQDGVEFDLINSPESFSLSGGVTNHAADEGDLIDGFDKFANADEIDVSLIPCGPVSPSVAKYVVQNIAEQRMDCVAFVSPCTSSGGRISGINAVEDTVSFRTGSSFNVNSSYGFMDSGWKYQYDRYNDNYVWVPLCGDTAGLCARTDSTNDPWWSPGGLNRGQVRSVVKLNINPSKAERDLLYRNGINPVVTFPGQGTVLFGDKTLLARPSAFDRINVRRLFIVLEKAIATAAKFQLFEFNDSFTRAQFVGAVEPFMRDVQARRGVTDFAVVCNERNNTADIIDRNEFVADIFIKPNRSINFITLNFIATRSGISFEEVGA